MFIVLRVLGYVFLNWGATFLPEYHYVRIIGMFFHTAEPKKDIKLESQKLLLEVYFDMTFAVILNFIAFNKDGREFKDFFKGGANIFNSVLTILLALVMICYFIYGTILIVKSYKEINKKEIKQDLYDQLEPFIEGSNHKTFNAAMMNIYFMSRRIAVSYTLIFLE